jgi:hypothetical protein
MSKGDGLKKRRRTRNVVSFQNSVVTMTLIIDFFITGRSTLMHQKVAELGMAANQEPGAIDWEIIPNTSIYDNSMNVDPHADEWEDIFEENMGPKGKAVTRLQTIISCASPLPSRIFVSVTAL